MMLAVLDAQFCDALATCNVPCRQVDGELFFAENPADLQAAKQVCAGCPLKAQCLAGALARAEPWGVWGGEIFDDGVIIAAKRPRGRPRKQQAA